MDLNFRPVATQDGSLGLYNETVDDIYHSSRGARTEAFEKFIYPSGIAGKLKNNNSIKILDVCYGMGYNTKAVIDTCLKNDFKGIISIDALEMDPDVVAFSFLVKDKYFDFYIMDFLDFDIFEDDGMITSIFKIMKSDDLKDFLTLPTSRFFCKNTKGGYKDVSDIKINSNLHNIYYRNISHRNIEKFKPSLKHPEIALRVCLGDARKTVCQLAGNYDCIFLDAFTPDKLPTLWSVEFFKILKDLLKPDGNITTYSNAATIRSGMREAGLFVGKTQYGTIAYKDENFVETPLDGKSLGLLETKAGIPFYDKDLNSTAEEILVLRKKMVSESTKQSSSQFLKHYPKKNR